MKIRYDSEANILMMIIRNEPHVDSIEEDGGIIVSYGKDGESVSVEFLNASVRKLINPDEVSVVLETKR